MNTQQIELVKSTWGYVLAHSGEAMELFYGRLFEIAPEVRPLFKEDIKIQAQKLKKMVTLIVAKLNKLEEIENEIKYLAQKHEGYGAKPEHYHIVGEALLWTLEKGLKDRWTDEVKEAWVAVYSILSNAMIKVVKPST
ncbi:MAG: globin domain-containing protein [Cytophagaceae bacterium]|nr:globin domain-containing protein [Cytophagaceae bacterium]MDW8456016.1 globin family protein [Cytophagaceae bacterium]